MMDENVPRDGRKGHAHRHERDAGGGHSLTMAENVSLYLSFSLPPLA